MSINPVTAFEFEFMDKTFAVSTSVVKQWAVMVIIIALVLIVTRNISKVPSKKQTVVEMVVGFINGLVSSNMGEEYRKAFTAFIGTLGIFLVFLNTSGLVGVSPSTKDISVTATFAIITFLVINGNAIAKNGLGGYMLGYFHPYIPMLPLNIIEKFTIPLSLCLRLFINMLVGTIFLELIYEALGYFAFAIPVPLHFFFDLFVGLIQTYVFMMLTMVYIKQGAAE